MDTSSYSFPHDTTRFKEIDRIAQIKEDLQAKRKAELEPPAPPPTNFELYRNRRMHERPVKVDASSSSSSSSASSASSHAASTIGSSARKPIASISDSSTTLPPQDTRSSLVLLRASRTPDIEDEEAFEWLKDRGFDCDLVRKPKEFGWCPLHQAVEEGSLALCDWLMKHGAAEDVQRADDAGLTPLKLASMRQDLAMVRWLYNHGAAEVYRYNPHS